MLAGVEIAAPEVASAQMLVFHSVGMAILLGALRMFTKMPTFCMGVLRSTANTSTELPMVLVLPLRMAGNDL